MTEIDLKDFTWLTRKEAAEHLRVHVRTVDKWADEGRITRYKVEGIQSVRFKREELDALMVPEVGLSVDLGQAITLQEIVAASASDPFAE